MTKPVPRHRRSLFNLLGPGLITGAADDDPSGIATYSQAGAQTGFGLLWTVFLTTPFMTAIQIISARIGAITGRGIAANARTIYPRPLVLGLIALLCGANAINIAADLAAMGEAMQMLIGGPPHLYAAAFGLFCLMLEVFISYRRYAPYLKGLTLALFAYVAAAFSVDVPWADVFTATFIPRLSFSPDYWFLVVAILGTTISPYLFFWQAAEEVEEDKLTHSRSFTRSPQRAQARLKEISIDTWIGMVFSNLVAFFIIVTTAATLHKGGVTDIQTASQAAEALRPIAGPFTFFVFAAGIIGTGLLAVPVLAGSAAYAVADAFGWRSSLELTVMKARGFYLILGGATCLGILLALTRIDPIKLLLWSAVINGIAAAPIMAMMMGIVTSKRVLGDYTVKTWLAWVGWGATGLMGLTVFALIASLFLG
ncbi:divalent metal cation transporter [Microvirga mediterraneensis]|uniref:Divalent metal cation transporter n=1 Tax=Microvirga mediterraneensis TaxID=2754695 RepID=A0A838BJW2_9HYPH|nr:divalent metal cation transporter [Microvirga mediterraneensis]